MLDMNVTVVYYSQSFTDLINLNHSDTETKSQVELVSDILKFKSNTTTHIKCQKHPLPGKEYPCFQTDIKSEQEAQCNTSTSLTEFMDNIISIESF